MEARHACYSCFISKYKIKHASKIELLLSSSSLVFYNIVQFIQTTYICSKLPSIWKVLNATRFRIQRPRKFIGFLFMYFIGYIAIHQIAIWLANSDVRQTAVRSRKCMQTNLLGLHGNLMTNFFLISIRKEVWCNTALSISPSTDRL